MSEGEIGALSEPARSDLVSETAETLAFAGAFAGDVDVEGVLLRALAAMAVRSKRRQADLGAVLRASDLRVGRDRILVAVDALARQGFVENVVPLSDGGLLLSVTSRGVERLSPASSWHAAQPLSGWPRD